jgi:hypothetical protein
MPLPHYLLLPIAFPVGVLGEILARTLTAAVRVVVGVFALGTMVSILALFLTTPDRPPRSLSPRFRASEAPHGHAIGRGGALPVIDAKDSATEALVARAVTMTKPRSGSAWPSWGFGG